MTTENLEKAVAKKNLKLVDDLLASIGFGGIQPMGIANIMLEDVRQEEERLRKEEQERAVLEEHQEIEAKPANNDKKHSENGINVQGIDSMLVRLSHCCSPIPGDKIMGYVTKGRGVSVHREDCPNIKAAGKNGMPLIDVSWNTIPDPRKYYDAELEVEGYNRNGLINDILQAINNSAKSLSSINGRVDHNKQAVVTATVGIKNSEHLQRVVDKIKQIPDVYVVKRVIH